MTGREPIPLRDAVAAVNRGLGLPEPETLSRLVAAWEQIVGPDLAGHARVRAVRDGVCTIVVDAPVWATEARYREADIVEGATRVCGPGVVRTVRVVVGAPRKPA